MEDGVNDNEDLARTASARADFDNTTEERTLWSSWRFGCAYSSLRERAGAAKEVFAVAELDFAAVAAAAAFVVAVVVFAAAAVVVRGNDDAADDDDDDDDDNDDDDNDDDNDDDEEEETGAFAVDEDACAFAGADCFFLGARSVSPK